MDEKCQTSADEIGPCEHNGCPTTRSFFAIPKVFQNGRRPDAITPATVASGFDNAPDVQGTPSTGGSPDIGSGPDDQSPSAPSDEMPSSEESEEDPAQKPVENDEGQSDAGICKGSICCASSCGKCGGSGCHLRPGGGPSCCMGRISESGKSCSRGGPPCIRD